MYTQLLILIVLFIVYLIPQAMIINGIFLASRGETEILPNGNEEDGFMIFYPLRKLLEQKDIERIYYRGDMKLELVRKIFYQFPTLSVLENLTEDQLLMWKKQSFQIENTFSIKLNIDSKTGYISFYKEYPLYRFSKYVRKPIFGCIICMASFWGLFTFLIPALFAFHFDPIIFALYFPNTACLGYLNYKIMKPL